MQTNRKPARLTNPSHINLRSWKIVAVIFVAAIFVYFGLQNSNLGGAGAATTDFGFNANGGSISADTGGSTVSTGSGTGFISITSDYNLYVHSTIGNDIKGTGPNDCRDKTKPCLTLTHTVEVANSLSATISTRAIIHIAGGDTSVTQRTYKVPANLDGSIPVTRRNVVMVGNKPDWSSVATTYKPIIVKAETANILNVGAAAHNFQSDSIEYRYVALYLNGQARGIKITKNYFNQATLSGFCEDSSGQMCAADSSHLVNGWTIAGNSFHAQKLPSPGSIIQLSSIRKVLISDNTFTENQTTRSPDNTFAHLVSSAEITGKNNKRNDQPAVIFPFNKYKLSYPIGDPEGAYLKSLQLDQEAYAPK